MPLHENLNPLSFRLGEFGFAGMTFQVPENSLNYTTVQNLSSNLGVNVEVSAGLDLLGNEAFWIFQAIDPITNLYPSLPDIGFLPINDSLGRGQGFVRYSISPKSTTITGDTTTARAEIVFDINDPIETNIWENTIDAGAPSSALNTIPATTDTTSITLSWNATDDPGGSGVDFVDLYVKQDTGSFYLFRSQIKDDSISFRGQSGNTYCFYTLATDHVGNKEPHQPACEQTITMGIKGKTFSGNLWHKGDGSTGVAQAEVALSGDTLVSFSPTPASGTFSLSTNIGSMFTITPRKTTNILNGLDAADATSIQQHLTGINTITDFFRLVAADANRSYSISTLDALIIRQALLGNPQAIAIMNATKSWRFIPTDYNYPNPAGPYTLPAFPEKRNLVNVSTSITGLDFYGVKVGDVHESGTIADPGNKPDHAAKPLVWTVRDRLLKAGEPVDVQFSALNFTDISAFQFALRFDTAQLHFERIEILTKDIPIDVGGNFGLYNIEDGELRVVWNVAAGITRPDPAPIFRIHFTASIGGQLLSQTLQAEANILPAVAYNTSLQAREVLLVFADYQTLPVIQKHNSETAVGPRFQLLPNRPNPFRESTVFGFLLPEACAAQLRVLDINGRVLWQINGNYSAGYHEQAVSWNDLEASGVLFYELTSPYGALVRKMVLVGR